MPSALEYAPSTASSTATLRSQRSSGGEEEDFEDSIPALCVGDVISDNCGNSYTLESLLGIGSFGQVYLARHSSSGQQFALKCLYKTCLSPVELDMQRMEAKLHEQAGQHPNVVTLHGSFESDEWLFLVLEYCAGSDMYDWIVNQNLAKTLDTPGMTEAEADRLAKRTAGVFVQVLRAVAHIHERGIYHCDLKPENFMAVEQPSNGADGVPLVKLSDFGLATTETDSVDFGRGSRPYISAECRHGEKLVRERYDSAIENEVENSKNDTAIDGEELVPYMSAANDVWALGAILANLFYGVQLWSDPDSDDHHYSRFERDGASFIGRRCSSGNGLFSNPVVTEFLASRVFCPQEERCTISEFLDWAEQTLFDGRNVYSLAAAPRLSTVDMSLPMVTPAVSHNIQPIPISATPSVDSTSDIDGGDSGYSLSKTLVASLPTAVHFAAPKAVAINTATAGGQSSSSKLPRPSAFSWADMDDEDFDLTAVVDSLSFKDGVVAHPPSKPTSPTRHQALPKIDEHFDTMFPTPMASNTASVTGIVALV